MKKMLPSIVLITQALFIYSCGDTNKINADEIKNTTSSANLKNDTLGNEPFCSLVIGGKEYTVAIDSITTSFGRLDSSFQVTIKGINGGWVILDIPNILKCPCKIPTGYKSIYRKIYGTEDYAEVPTVGLYNYGRPDFSLNNLNDGFHKKAIADNAMEIISMCKLSEDTLHKWVGYLIKGKINTTVLKNVYESAAGNINKDYKVEGAFVIKKEIHF